jgi:hypothetical protein
MISGDSLRTKMMLAPSCSMPSTSQPAVSQARECILCESLRHHEGNRALPGKGCPTRASISDNVKDSRSTPGGCPAKNAANLMYLRDLL